MKIIIKRLKANSPTRIRCGVWVAGGWNGDFILWCGSGRSLRQAKVKVKARVAMTGANKVYPV